MMQKVLFWLLFLIIAIKCNDNVTQDDYDDEDYQPITYHIRELNDENFEEITHITKLKGSETWFILFHRNDEASKICIEQLEKLLEEKKLYHVNIGAVNFNDEIPSPNTEYRFGLTPMKSYRLILFKSTSVRESGVSSSKMYIYDGGISIESIYKFITVEYKTKAKDIFPVKPPLTTYDRHMSKAEKFFKHIDRHFNGAFHRLGFGEYSWFSKGIILYLIVMTGSVTFGGIFIYMIKRCLQHSNVDEDSDIEQEEDEFLESNKS